MAVELFVASSGDVPLDQRSLPEITLSDNGYYWFLYSYFESANLDRSRELIDLYGDAEITGYQLERLEQELLEARQDVAHRPGMWSVLVGWTEEHRSNETERRQPVERQRLMQLIDQLLSQIDLARTTQKKLIALGD